MKRVFVTLAVAMALVLGVVQTAFSCDKPGKEACPFASGKATMTVVETPDGEGFLVDIVVTGTEQEIKEISEKVEKHITGCIEGKCDCTGTGNCPYQVAGLKYDVKKVEKGVQVNVSGGCPGKRAKFKARMDAMISCKGDEACMQKALEGSDKGGCTCGDAGKCDHGEKK